MLIVEVVCGWFGGLVLVMLFLRGATAKEHAMEDAWVREQAERMYRNE
jgi:hypothetical protein